MGDSLIIKIGANAKEFDSELKKLKEKTRALENGLAKVAKISAVAFAGLAAAVGVAVNKFSDFEKTFTNVQTLLDKSSFKTKSLSKGIQGLKNDVLKLGSASGESFENLNQGLFDLVSAGVPAEQATAALTDAVNLATAGATDTATAVKALTASYTAYGEEAGSTSQIAEKFFTAQKFGVTTVGELATGFNKVVGTAKALKIGFNEILAASTALTANGAKPTAQAFTEMKAVLNAVVLAQGKLKNESVGVQNALSLQNVEQVGIVQALQEFKTATGGSVVEMQRMLGSAEALSGVISLTGEQAGLYTKILGEMNDEQRRAATFQEALTLKQETTEKAIAKLKQSYNALAITIGERFAPLLIEVANKLSALAQRFSSLTEAQKDSIANFIKWGLIIAGGITTLTTVGLAIIKVSALLATIGTVLFTAGGAAATFWLALTGPIGLAVAGLIAVGAGVAKLYSVLNQEPEDTLENTISKLDDLKEKQKELEKDANTNRLGQKNRSQQRLDEVNAEIAKLEELKRKQIELGNSEETGSLLIRPTTDGSDPFAGLDKDLGQQELPLESGRTQEGIEAEKAAAAEKLAIEKKSNTDVKAVVDEATKDKIQAAKDANELLKAESINVSAEEIALIKRKNELEQQENIANKIKNDELRALEIENIRIQKEALITEEQEYQARKAEELAIAREQEAVLNEELSVLDAETRAALNEKDLEQLRGSLLNKKTAKQAVAKEEAAAVVASRNQELKDTEKHGVAVAKINKFLATSEVQGVKTAAGELVQLQNSKNKSLKAIGKRAAQVQIGIDTARGAISAYTSLSGIPLVGPVLGGLAAAAVISYGAERMSEVNSAQRGGVVPNAAGGARDRVPMLLEPNELVVPKGLASNFVQSVGNPASGDFANDDASAGEESGSTIRLEGDLVQNEEFVAALASQLRDLNEFDNVRAS